MDRWDSMKTKGNSFWIYKKKQCATEYKMILVLIARKHWGLVGLQNRLNIYMEYEIWLD